MLAFGNAPDDMQRFLVGVILQDKNRGSFVEVGIILNNCSVHHAIDHVANQYVICRQFIVAMQRDSNFASLNQGITFCSVALMVKS